MCSLLISNCIQLSRLRIRTLHQLRIQMNATAAFTLSFRSQSLEPAFFTTIVWSPSVTCTSDGVFPTKLPSTSMSALSGIEATDILPLD